MEGGAYQLLEVITNLQTIFHPQVSLYRSIWHVWSDQQHSACVIAALMVWFEQTQKKSACCLFWSLFDQWHSSLLAFRFIHLGYEYLAYIFHMQLVDGSCPQQEHADKFSITPPPPPPPFPRPLVSLDTTYEVNFTLSSWISAPISRCLRHIRGSGRDRQPAGRARLLPWNACRVFTQWSLPPFITICRNVAPQRDGYHPGDTVDQRERGLWLIFSRQSVYWVSSPADQTFQCECNSSEALKATRSPQTSISTRCSLSLLQTVTKVTQALSCFLNRPP